MLCNIYSLFFRIFFLLCVFWILDFVCVCVFIVYPFLLSLSYLCTSLPTIATGWKHNCSQYTSYHTIS